MDIRNIIKDSSDRNINHMEKIEEALNKKFAFIILNQIKKRRNDENAIAIKTLDQVSGLNKQVKEIGKIMAFNFVKLIDALEGDTETGLVGQMKNMRNEQNEIATDTLTHVSRINNNIMENGKVMVDKFDDIMELFKKSGNGNPLVE